MADKPIVVVTGATGFIAKHVVVALLNAGYAVRGTSRSGSRLAEMQSAIAPHLVSKPDSVADFSLIEADLNADAGWAEAMDGAEAVLHTASPFPAGSPRDEQALIRPAVAGTRRVLSAAAEAGIRRVVLTSSVAAVGYGHPGRSHFDEGVWSNLEGRAVSAYTKSKTLAERAAWELADEIGLALTAINPALVLGPALDLRFGTSVEIVQALLSGRLPVLPNLILGVVDVRDVAAMHVAALQDEASVGGRYMAVAGNAAFTDMAAILRGTYPDARVPRLRLPDWIVRAAGLVNRDAAQLAADLGKVAVMDNSRGLTLLGRAFRSPREAVLGTAESLYELGAVKPSARR